MSKPIRQATESSTPDILAWRVTLLRRIGVFLASGLLLGIGVFLGNEVLLHFVVTARQNHVYCDLIKAGMSESEINAALLEIGEQHQITFDGPIPFGRLPKEGLQDMAFYRIVRWNNVRVEFDYNLWLWLGYDTAGRLVWEGRQTSADNVVTIGCPWTLGEHLATR